MFLRSSHQPWAGRAPLGAQDVAIAGRPMVRRSVALALPLVLCSFVHFLNTEARGQSCSTQASTAGATCGGAPPCAATCSPAAGGGHGCASGGFDAILYDPGTSLGDRAGPDPQALGLIDLEPILEPIRARFRVPGLAVALVLEGEVAAAGAVGARMVGSRAPLELGDRFHLGSCGKAITATAAAVLVERGLIRWDTTIGEQFPELGGTADETYGDVTLSQLLAHRGGLPPRSDAFDRSLMQLSGALPRQREQLVRMATADTPIGPPGTVFRYTDTGYAIAGAMLERAAGMSWEHLIAELVAEPLGLTSLGFGAPGAPDETVGAGSHGDPLAAPRGHVLVQGELAALGVGPGRDLANPVIGPAGTIHMSVLDWASFAADQLAGARSAASPPSAAPGSEAARTLLSAESYDLLHADHEAQGYGLGWGIGDSPWGAGRALSHTGSCGAWAAWISVLPEQNAAVVAATNYGGVNGYAALRMAVAGIGAEYLSREPSRP